VLSKKGQDAAGSSNESPTKDDGIALFIYQQLQERAQSVVLQARKILTQHIYGMVDQGERDEQRLTVGGLAHLKAVERDHAIKSAQGAPSNQARRVSDAI
jgi:hypothetical protein